MDLYETKSGYPIDLEDIIEQYEDAHGYPPSQVIIDTIIERKLESGEWSVG